MSTESGVIVDSGPAGAILTAGPPPIGVTLKPARTSAAYRAVARALAPVGMAREIMVKGYFNGPKEIPKGKIALTRTEQGFSNAQVDFIFEYRHFGVYHLRQKFSVGQMKPQLTS